MTRGYRWLLIGPEHPRDPASATQSNDASTEETLLFARGQESVRIIICPATMTLQVLGPGRLQKSLEFESAAALDEFLQSYEQQAVGTGWTLLDVTERRAVDRT